jgi:hypothetical protein
MCIYPVTNDTQQEANCKRFLAVAVVEFPFQVLVTMHVRLIGTDSLDFAQKMFAISLVLCLIGN